MDVLGASELLAFVPTVDVHRARVFYEDALGLPLVEQSELGFAVEAYGTMLRILPTPSLVPASYPVVGWRVDDIAATVTWLSRRGIDLQRYAELQQDEAGIWTNPDGDQVAWFTDPDGNLLSITEFA